MSEAPLLPDPRRAVLNGLRSLGLTVVDELEVTRTASGGVVEHDLRVEVRGPSGGLHGVRLAVRASSEWSLGRVSVSWSSLPSTPRVRSLGLDVLEVDAALPEGSPGTLLVPNATLRRVGELLRVLVPESGRVGSISRLRLPAVLDLAPDVRDAADQAVYGRELSVEAAALLTSLLDDLETGAPLEWVLRHRSPRATP